MDGLDAGFFEVFDEFGLFFGVEAEVGIDREDEEALVVLFAWGKKVFGRFFLGLYDGIVTGPHVDDAEVGVGVEALGEFLPLIEHVALELILHGIPREGVFVGFDVTSRATLEGVEVDEGLVRNHASKGEAVVGAGSLVIITSVEMGVVFDGEDLLEEDEPVQNGGFKARSNRDDGAHPLGVSRGKGEGTKAADGWANHGVELVDAVVVEKGDVEIDEVSDVKSGEGRAEWLSGFWIDRRRGQSSHSSRRGSWRR